MIRYLYIILVFYFFFHVKVMETIYGRGSHYYDWQMFNEAILEFNKSKFYYMSKSNKSYDDIKLFQTHYNLAITYSKLGMFMQIML